MPSFWFNSFLSASSVVYSWIANSEKGKWEKEKGSGNKSFGDKVRLPIHSKQLIILFWIVYTPPCWILDTIWYSLRCHMLISICKYIHAPFRADSHQPNRFVKHYGWSFWSISSTFRASNQGLRWLYCKIIIWNIVDDYKEITKI